MVKEITEIKYGCEICGLSYDKKQLALDCEQQGAPKFNYGLGDPVVAFYNKGEPIIGEIVEQLVVGRSHKPRYRVKIDGLEEVKTFPEHGLTLLGFPQE